MDNHRKCSRPVPVLVPNKQRRRGEPLKDSVNRALDKASATLGVRRIGRIVSSDSFAKKSQRKVTRVPD
jgi:hypothetical protein